MDIRYVVTSLTGPTPEHIYEKHYCQRGQAEKWSIRQAMPDSAKLAKAEFATIRLRLLKVGVRIIETASCIRIAFASACPDAEQFRQIALRLRAAPA